MSPVQSDPFTAVTDADILASELNARFDKLYDLQNPAEVGIDSSNTKAGPTLLATQQAWQTVALSGGSFSGNLSYFKDSLGIVHFRGDTITGDAPLGTTIGTLPVGYRPGTAIHLVANRANAITMVPITINTTGTIVWDAFFGASTGWSFGLCHFRAEN